MDENQHPHNRILSSYLLKKIASSGVEFLACAVMNHQIVEIEKR
jgi:hypothetical protein